MSIRVVAPGPDGSAFLVHSSASRDEHFFVARVRRTTTTTLLPCHLCDAVTVIPRDDSNEQHREIEALVSAGSVVPLAVADSALDPLQAGKDDALAGVTTPGAARHKITVVPQDTDGRRALIATLRADHCHRSPRGTTYQKWLSETTFEVRESDGEGRSTLVSQHSVDAEGRIS